MLCFPWPSRNFSSGCVRLDLNIIKPSRIEFLQDPERPLTVPDGQASSPTGLEYVYLTAHPTVCCLPTKLAEWIRANMQDALGFADKADRRAESASGLTPAGLNNILRAHVVNGALTTFGCVKWVGPPLSFIDVFYHLIPWFLAGNKTPTIPHIISKRKDSDFPFGCADAAALDGRRGSNGCEVNP